MSDRRVFILGAGFSRAISEHMPLTDELGSACSALVPSSAVQDFPSNRAGNFENWLSQIAEEQPYLNTSTNLSNQALFYSIGSAIAEVLQRRTQTVLREGWPQWFPVLLRAMHFTRSTAITFNYDTLVECAVASNILFEWGMHQPVPWTELTGDIPSWPPGDVRWGSEPYETFRLLKLHGSLNWYWSEGDATGVSVARRDLPGRFGAAEPYFEEDRRRHLPGRVPFIVPPASAKSVYYRNPISKEMWQQAALNLRLADEVVLIGYSLPLTDLTVGAMLRSAVASSEAKLTVVDLQPDAVAERLQQLGIKSSRITTVGPTDSQSAIERYCLHWTNDISTTAAAELFANGAPTAPMAVVWGPIQLGPVVGFDRNGTQTVLRIEQIAMAGLLDRKVDAPGQMNDALVRLGSLPASGQLSVQRPDGSTDLIIASGSAEFPTGHGKWNILYPSGPTPLAT